MEWVVKERFPGDQRRVRVSLTATSLKLVATLSEDLEARYAQIESQVGRDVVDRAYQAIDALLTGLERESA